MSKKPKTYGRGPARRYFIKRAKEARLKIVYRRGITWWFKSPHRVCNIVCMRYGRFIMRNLEPVRLRWAASFPDMSK